MGIGRLRLPFTIDVMFTWSNCYLATKSAVRSLKKKERKKKTSIKPVSKLTRCSTKTGLSSEGSLYMELDGILKSGLAF